jgi:oligogalacturonide lyase
MIGRTWPSERSGYVDPLTGITVRQVTNSPTSSDTHFYFHDPAWTADSRWFVFRSDRTGQRALFGMEADSGRIVQVTDEGSGGGWVSHLSNEVIYVQGREIRAADLDTLKSRTIGEFPDGVSFHSGPSLNADGTLCVFGGKSDGQRGLFAMSTETGQTSPIWLSDGGPSHVNCSPTDPELIMHCDSTLPDSEPKQRVWVLSTDGKRHWHPYTQSPQEWLTHESWLGQTGKLLICYWPIGIMEIEVDGSGGRLIANVNAWHAGASADGAYCVVDTNWPDRGVHLVETATGRMRVLAESKNKPDGTGAHPHPSFSPDGKLVVFGSELSGSPEIYMVETEQALVASDAWYTQRSRWTGWG